MHYLLLFYIKECISSVFKYICECYDSMIELGSSEGTEYIKYININEDYN